MTLYIESGKTDPCYNLALEQFVFDTLGKSRKYFMLWQNHSSVIVGKHQNTNAEINTSFVNAHNISVVRRLSGGGAVYHDLGNINFTFITGANRKETVDLTAFCEPIQKALISFGVPAEISGRNDMVIEGKKISGNAQYIRYGRIMHHGTLLYDTDLDALSNALNPANDKIESKAIKSVKSRVINIRPYMKTDLPVNDFFFALKEYMFNSLNLREYKLSNEEEAQIEKLKETVYSQWSWNYGASPPYNARKTRRIENCGTIEILLDMEKEGIIKHISFFGDFFSNSDLSELSAMLTGCRLNFEDLKRVLHNINIQNYFCNLEEKDFLSVLLN